MYFVHSYYVDPSDKKNILTYSKYENFEYCSSIINKNIFATQFHPEKVVLKVLKSIKIGVNYYEKKTEYIIWT